MTNEGEQKRLLFCCGSSFLVDFGVVASCCATKTTMTMRTRTTRTTTVLDDDGVEAWLP